MWPWHPGESRPETRKRGARKLTIPLTLAIAGAIAWLAVLLAAPTSPVEAGSQATTPAGAWLSASATPLPSPTAGPSVESVLSKVSDLRELPAKSQVPLGKLDKSQLRDYLVSGLEEEQTRETLQKDKAILVLLDMLKEGDDLADLQLGLLSEQVSAFYEFDSRQMTMVEPVDDASAMAEAILAHELTHALQDQHFDLGARLKEAKEDGEQALALRSLAEGDATMAMIAYAAKNMTAAQLTELASKSGGIDSEKLDSAPLFLQVSLLFPYQAGTSFVSALLRSGGWEAVNKAYANPPSTSEQIMHPSKYLAGEGAKPVEVPDVAAALGPEWSLWDDDTLGEVGVLAYLADGVPLEDAALACSGWGGDRILLFRKGEDEHALVVVSVWDTPEDAEDMFWVTSDFYESRSETEVTYSDDDDQFTWSGPSRFGYARLDGSRVLIAVSTSETTTRTMADVLAGDAGPELQPEPGKPQPEPEPQQQ